MGAILTSLNTCKLEAKSAKEASVSMVTCDFKKNVPEEKLTTEAP